MHDYKYYQNLSNEATDSIISKLFVEITDENQIEDELLNLALYVKDYDFSRLFPVLIENECFYPAEIYRHADASVADRLIAIIENGYDCPNNLLACLAWIGSQNVVDFFMKSSSEKPEWTNELYVMPDKYAECAGWEIGADGNKRELFSKSVQVLKPRDEVENNGTSFKSYIDLDVDCPFCNNKLSTIFNLPIAAKNIEFATCTICSCYYPVFMNIDNVGKATWHHKNQKWEHLTDDMVKEPVEQNPLVLTDEKREPQYACNQFAEISKSQIGGLPSWVQDSDYLKCPDCGKTMDFVAQIDMEDVEEYGEGMYYLHYCNLCSIVGTNYQQT